MRLLSRLRRRPANIFWVTPSLAVGGASTVRDPRSLARYGVGAVLDVQAESGDRAAEFAAYSLSYLKLPVEDFAAPDQQQLEIGTGWVLDRLEEGATVFIHCRQGLGRSVTFAVATLVRMGYDLRDAYNEVRRGRAQIALSETQLAALKHFCTRLQR
jgi:protein-tyrosine phosphatase